MSERIFTVVMPARNEIEALQGGLVERVFENIPNQYEPTVVLAVGDSNEEFVSLTNEMGRNLPNLNVLQLGPKRRNMLAYAYLEGINHALGDGADLVIDMDATQAHDPKDLSKFAEVLEDHDGAMASRFSKGGEYKYPFQRKAISYGGTMMSNLFLGVGGYYPDLTSGYEGFRSEVFDDIFSITPKEEWLSVKRGPNHLFHVELRAYALWLGNSVGIVPIVHGANRVKDPDLLPAETVAKALTTFFHLRQRRSAFVNQENGNK